jgi:HEPN domain-containing protein
MSLPKDPPAQNSPDSLPVAAPTEPDHWLFRLTAEQWLRAADNELAGAARALSGKQQRAGVTYARRAAGMALNARLCVAFDEAYGRSYMDHLSALQKDATVSTEVREAATRLLAQPLTQQLVTLGPKGDLKPAELAGRIIEYARQLVLRSASPATG